MHAYKNGKTYTPGTVVTYKGKVYSKANDGDNSPPDSVPGGWTEISGPNTNVQEYVAIQQSLGSYEQRAKDHKAEVLAKLAAEGLSPDDVRAVLNAK